MVSAPPVTSYTIELIDTDGVVVVLLLRVEDAAPVNVLLLVAWDVDDCEDDSGASVEDESADGVANDGADESDVVLVEDVDDDGDGEDEDGAGDDGVEGVSEACADVEEAAE